MLGKRIRLFRSRKGLKQKELGEIVGFMGKTSDVRIAQYETEARTPKDDLIKQLADIFGVTPRAITVPNIDSYLGLMHTFFALEDEYGFKISTDKNGLPCITLDEKHQAYDQIAPMLFAWLTQYSKLKQGELSQDEYDNWRYNYPNIEPTTGFVRNAISDDLDAELQDALRKKFNVKYDYTILYAPSWEYFNKEDDFIKALSSLKVNLVVKQASWPESYSWVTDSINEMRKMHEGTLDNLYYIESEESIMVALEMCDMVVSDESNVMAEALMFGKPSVAVTDWLIPDKNPPRCADVTMDYVIKCRKAELRETVENVMNNPDKYKSVMDNGKKLYSNQGNVCKDVMDLIDYYTQNGDSDSFMDKKITVDYSRCGLWI